MKTTTLSVALLISSVLAATPVTAKTLYLNNGDEIEYQSAWKDEGRIYVLINRDTVVDFSPQEIDQKKSFKAKKAKKAIKHKRVPKKPKAPPSPALVSGSGKGEQKQPAPAAQPAPTPKPAAPAVPPASKK